MAKACHPRQAGDSALRFRWSMAGGRRAGGETAFPPADQRVGGQGHYRDMVLRPVSSRIILVAETPSISGICMFIKTRS
jgi:hypothetical protein